MYTRDWRTALRTPPTYRIGNRTLRFNYHFSLLILCVLALFVLFFYVKTGSSSSSESAYIKNYSNNPSMLTATIINNYNSTYPITPPLIEKNGGVSYRIAMVADLDTNSKHVKPDGSAVWQSYLKKGYLSFSGASEQVSIRWDAGEPTTLESSFARADRGMELSELVTFNGKLLTFDDRTGLIYQLINEKPIPWVILLDGNGISGKGYKGEWATVKDQILYVGSMGKEWTSTTGEFMNDNPMYVKEVTTTGEVRSHNWSFNYKILREESLQIIWPGYMIHESGVWSDVHKRWFFLPRRCTKEKYNETRDEYMGCNVLISADEHFGNVQTVHLDATNSAPTHGFSSFKFIPGTEDRFIVALKSEELNGKMSTFISVFGIDGKVILPQERIETDFKYEGIEFI